MGAILIHTSTLGMVACACRQDRQILGALDSRPIRDYFSLLFVRNST